MNALANAGVAKHLNDNFVCTYLKVGAFQIINGQKVGGNVASYFCLADGSVLHAVAGPVNANRFLTEARWANDIHRSAQAASTNLETGKVDRTRFARQIRMAHGERFHDLQGGFGQDKKTIPTAMPTLASQEAKTHWLLAKTPLAPLDTVYPVVWQQILRERLSELPVARR